MTVPDETCCRRIFLPKGLKVVCEFSRGRRQNYPGIASIASGLLFQGFAVVISWRVLGGTIMPDQLFVGPMSEDFPLWRCLHAGPVTADDIDTPPPNPQVDWDAARSRNIPLLKRLTQTYGACAILAGDGHEVVATLRFYPKFLCSFGDAGAGFCLQQSFPYGPANDLAERYLPPLSILDDKTLFVHCLLVTAPPREPDRYRRKGLASRLVQELVRWAGEQGWRAIEANAYEEIPLLYAIGGVAGRVFWEKLGFGVACSDVEPAITGELFKSLAASAGTVGIPADRVANRYRMRLTL